MVNEDCGLNKKKRDHLKILGIHLDWMEEHTHVDWLNRLGIIRVSMVPGHPRHPRDLIVRGWNAFNAFRLASLIPRPFFCGGEKNLFARPQKSGDALLILREILRMHEQNVPGHGRFSSPAKNGLGTTCALQPCSLLCLCAGAQPCPINLVLLAASLQVGHKLFFKKLFLFN